MTLQLDTLAALTEREKLQTSLDGFMMSLYTLYDVTKVLPHPYDALNERANQMLHDFPSLAGRMNHYIETVTGIAVPEGLKPARVVSGE